jgi:predicted ATPase
MQAEFEKGHTLEELRKDEKSFQLHIAEAKASLEAHEDSSRLTFFDRGMQETVAFLQHFNIPTDTATDNLMRASDYKKVFLLEPLDVFENSIYRPADKEDLAFVHQFNTLLDKVYTNYGYTPVRVPPFSVPKRVQFILDNL